MNFYLNIIVYFLVGVLQDFMIALYTRLVSTKQTIWASLLSFIITAINLAVIYTLLTGLEDKGWIAILAYAIGNAVGTGIGMTSHAFIFKAKPPGGSLEI